MKTYTIDCDSDNHFQVQVPECHLVEAGNKLKKVVNVAKYRNMTIHVTVLSVDDSGPNLQKWTSLYSLPQRCSLAAKNQSLSVIELMLKGYDKKRIRKDWLDYFGATTAHTCLSEPVQEYLRSSGCAFEEAWKKILANSWDQEWFMKLPNDEVVDITNPPLFSYRHFFPVHTGNDYSLLSDFAIFQLDRGQLQKDNWLDASNARSAQYGRLNAEDKEAKSQTQEATTILKLKNGEDIMKLVGDKRRIICARKTGKLVKPPFIEDSGFTLGSHIAFELDSNER